MDMKFKKTRVGAVPVDWDVVKLGDVANRSEEHVEPGRDGKRPYIGLEHIRGGDGRLCAIGSSDSVTSLKTVFLKGDILFGKLRPNLKKIAVAPVDGVCSTDIIVIRPRDAVMRDFLFYRLHSDEAFDFAVGTAAGTKMPRTSWSMFRNYAFPCPPLFEQKRIAEILSAVDEAIEKADVVIDMGEELKKGLMQKFFKAHIPQPWPILELQDVTEKIADGEHLSPNTTRQGEVLLSAKDIGEGSISFENPKYVSRDDFNKFSLRCDPREEDVLIVSRGATIGRVCLVKTSQPFCLMGSVIQIRVNRGRLSPTYLAQFLTTPAAQNELLRTSGASAQQAIYLTHIRRFPLPVPPLKEQAMIAEVLVSMDDKNAIEMKSRRQLQEEKRALMQRLLMGRVRVR